MVDRARAARQVRIQIGPSELRDPVASFRDWRAPTAMGDKAAVRAKLLLGVAHGTLSAFVGRNNDVDGYWAIGKICRHAVELGTPAVTFDLLAGTASPAWEPAGAVCARAMARLDRHLETLKLSRSVIGSAVIELGFDLPAGAEGVRYRCTARLIDGHGRAYVAETAGSCWPHDPSREMRSARATPRGAGREEA